MEKYFVHGFTQPVYRTTSLALRSLLTECAKYRNCIIEGSDTLHAVTQDIRAALERYNDKPVRRPLQLETSKHSISIAHRTAQYPRVVQYAVIITIDRVEDVYSLVTTNTGRVLVPAKLNILKQNVNQLNK